MVSSILTAKQRKFVNEYVVSGNATQSAIKAGYSEKTARVTGQENLLKPAIKKAIEERLAGIESKKIGDAKEVLEFYFRVLRGEEIEEVPMSTADSVITVTKKPSIKDKVSVSKEIMKRFPLYDPMEKQKLKKLTADARISEAKAKAMEDNGQDMEQLLDKMLDTLTKESDKESKKKS